MGKAAEIMASLTSGDVSRHSSRHYGTVTAIDTAHDKVTVLLDGASEPTVCDSRDVKVYDNDRVEVEIRDHKAIIKANAKHQVTDDGVALDALDQAAIARGAAEDAVDDAAAAQRAATEAAASAASAEGSASTAANAATNAQASAGSAATAATNAQTSAGNAASSASAAQTSAGQAQSSAATAASAAQQASADASIAAGAASAAQADAATAKRAADRSLVQLSIVEDVSGTLNWIAEHGSYEATTDTSVVDGKVYFQLVSGDYVPVAQPTGNPRQQGWYILDITDSQTEYIMAHIAVTSRGLWVLPSGIGSETTPDTGETQADSDARQGDGYKVLLSSTGMTVYDGSGDAVATYGESTTFASDRDWYVGSSNAFIFYDASENAIQIGGANVTIGGLTPGQLAGSQIWTATADPTTPNYTFAISNLTGPSGVSPRVGDLVVRSYYRYTISSVSTTTVLTGNRTSIRGGTGAAGSSVTVSSVEYAYQLSTSGTTVPTGTWGSTPVAPTATQYAWTRTTTTYSDNTTAVTYTVGGKGGADGSPGTSVTISSKSVKYQASTSGTTTPTGTWLDSVPTVAQGSYLWTRTVVTYSTGDSTTAYSVARMGSDGQTGAAGPEAVVSISVTAVDFSAGTATLSASLRVNGTVTTPTSYKWTKGTATQQIGTNEQTLSVSGPGALNATYNCTVTWSGGTQTGSIDLAATSAVKTYAAATFATQGTVTSMQSSIEANAGAIELRATKTEAYQLSQPNLSPYFSSSPYNRTANSYWYGMGVNSNYTFTDMGDGWMRVQCTNSGSSVIRVDWYPIKCPSVVAGQPYTWLAEVRNNASTSASSGSDFYLVQNDNCQFWGQKATETIEGPGGTSMSINIGTCGSSYVLQKVQNAETASDGHWTNNDEASVVGLACWTFRCAANSSIDYEVRLSLYEGRYAGPYKPYSGTQLYASQAELKVANDAIDARVEKNGVIAAINVSPETGVTIDADRVNINGAAIFTSGRLSESSLNNAYDAKGAAATVQTNLDNLQVGGRNYAGKFNFSGSSITVNRIEDDWTVFSSSPSSDGRTWGYASCDFKTATLTAGTYTLTYEVLTTTSSTYRGLRVYDSANSLLATKDDFNTTGTKIAQFTLTTDRSVGLMVKLFGARIRLKLESGNKPTDFSPPPEDMVSQDELSVATDAIISRGEQLVINGTGFMGDNTNFSSWSFDGAVTNNSAGSFTLSTVASSTLFTDKMFPVDPSKEYIAEFDVKAGSGGAKMYAMLTYFDVDKLSITIQCVSYIDGSTTTLARELKNGDTKVYLTSVAGFNKTTTANHQRALIFWNYTNSYGYTYPPETYSRNYYYDLWADSSSFDTTNNTITLKAAWNHGTFPAGTSVSQNTSGNGYAYFWYVTNKALFPTAWTHISGTYGGVKSSGNPNAGNVFWPGTAYCKIGWLWNYGASSSDVQSQIWITNVSVKENRMMATQRVYYRSATAASVAAPTTWVTANGNVWSQWTTKVPRLTQNADGSGTKYPYLYTCEQHRMGDGSVICTAVLLDENTTVIDGGSIITNSITANKLQANSLTLGQISTSAQASMLNSNGLNLVSSQASKWKRHTVSESSAAGSSWATVSSTASTTRLTTVSTVPVDGDYVTISLASGWQVFVTFFDANGYTHTYLTWANPRTITLTNYSGVTSIGLTIRKSDNATITLDDLPSAKVKLERGNRATDWTPAPEDQMAYVDAVQVGGRNLMQKSLLVWQGSNNTTLDTSAYVSSGTIVCSRTASTNGGFYITQYTLMEPDTEYVVSFKAKCTSGSVTTLYVHGASPENHVVASAEVYAGGTLLGGFNTSLSVTLSSSSYTSFVLKFKTKATISTGSYLGHIIQWNKSASTAYTVEMAEFKFEKGNRPTDWTPAPEDQTTYVDTSLAESVGSITTTIDTEVDTLTDSITGVSNSLASLGGKVDGLVQKAAALEKKTQWVKWDDTEGMIFGENGTAFNTRLKAENMTFNYGNQTMMTLSATGGVDAPKVRTQRLELGSDWAITISGDMFAIDYIGS